MAGISKDQRLRIPLNFEDAMTGLLQVKLTADMPRAGATPVKPKKGKKRAKKPA